MAASTTPTPPSRSSPSGRTRAEQCRLNARAKSARKRQATLDALATLTREGRPCGRSAVARRAGVSLVFLRSHPDLLQRIDEAQAGHRAAAPSAAPSDAAKDHVIAALRRRLEETKQQLAAKDATIRDQRAEIERLYGKLASRGN